MDSAGRQDIFLSFINQNKGIIYKVANSYCHHQEDRKDLVQEIIIQLWRSFAKYDDQYKHSTWIYRIALNTAISFYRKESRRKYVSDISEDSIIDLVDDETANETEEDIGLLQKFISELKELDKAVILLYLEEKSYKEISEIIGISETNVATKISRCKKILKDKFSLIKK